MCVGLTTSDIPNILNGFSRNQVPNPEEGRKKIYSKKCLRWLDIPNIFNGFSRNQVSNPEEGRKKKQTTAKSVCAG